MNIPTSDMTGFIDQLNNPNKKLPKNSKGDNKKQNISPINKNLVLINYSDTAGCGHIRSIFPMTYLNAVFARNGKIIPMLCPFFITQENILVRTRSIMFQRQMSPRQIPIVESYKQSQSKYGYKMLYDIDDFIWKGFDEGEHIPPYNFASGKLTDDQRKASIAIMNMMDNICVSTEFLKDYISSHGVNKRITVVPNTVPRFFWGNPKKRIVNSKIKKPRIIYTGSPTHYSNEHKLAGDWGSGEWLEWVKKSVIDNKIDFLCMGGLPFFFECIKDKIKIIDWVNSLQYHLPVLNFNAHFNVGPLVPNYFNYSKSDLKAIESYAAGNIFVGSTFTNGKPSPYDNCFVKVTEEITMEQLDNVFDEYTEPEVFNKTVENQYKYMVQNGRYLESAQYVNFLASLL